MHDKIKLLLAIALLAIMLFIMFAPLFRWRGRANKPRNTNRWPNGRKSDRRKH